MGKILRLLRFLNLLEPGKNILSITKAAMWVCVIGLSLSVLTGREVDLVSILAFFSTCSLYAWRRYVQWKTGTILGDTSEPPAPPG